MEMHYVVIHVHNLSRVRTQHFSNETYCFVGFYRVALYGAIHEDGIAINYYYNINGGGVRNYERFISG